MWITEDSEMEEHQEMEKDSTSNVQMVAGQGSFITGTGDGTVREVLKGFLETQTS